MQVQQDQPADRDALRAEARLNRGLELVQQAVNEHAFGDELTELDRDDIAALAQCVSELARRRKAGLVMTLGEVMAEWDGSVAEVPEVDAEEDISGAPPAPKKNRRR